ncbi:hypothetical protein IFM89_032085 [Coptis chinensis]|uniref:K Homology domain-containing protein n=1 Tax=Coptis chinensis TaxID=261450 RepID=A0A835I533_9MAGN|nr:hypothetical protein IFM89_032085 [Coptis chinensis]
MGGEETAAAQNNNNNNGIESEGGNKRKTVELPDSIELVKQKVQAYVSRLVSDAETKRPRLDDSTTTATTPQLSTLSDAKKLTENTQSGPYPYMTQASSNYASQGSSKKIDIPNGKVGVIIGRAGDTIKSLQLQSGARIQVDKDTEVDPYSQIRGVQLFGTPEQISRAEQLIKDVIAESDAGGPGSSAARGFNSVPEGGEHFILKVPNNKVAMVIGKGGETIKSMQSKSGARIQVIPLRLPPGDTSTERNVHIDGTQEQIEFAKQLVNEVISENRVRNPPVGNNQMQQAYYPPANWVPPVQSSTPQPGYGYTQPGTYPAPPPAYYGSYPPQTVGWDQSNSVAGPPQQSTGNYYGQQNQTGSAAPNVNLSYGQTQSTSQNYEQGYSHQPQGSGQNISGQVPPYDQQNSYVTSGYGPPNVSSQLDGTIPTQPYATQPPAYQGYYGQSPAIAPTPAYGPQSYAGPLPPHPGYDQTGYTQSGYGGQPPAHPPAPLQSQPPISQPVYGQAGYPPQPAPLQSNNFQGATAYGMTHPQMQAQPPPKTYAAPLPYGAERNGDNSIAPANNVTGSTVQEVAQAQS